MQVIEAGTSVSATLHIERPVPSASASIVFEADGRIDLVADLSGGSMSRQAFQAYSLHTRMMLEPDWAASTLDWGVAHLRGKTGLGAPVMSREDYANEVQTAIVAVMQRAFIRGDLKGEVEEYLACALEGAGYTGPAVIAT